MHAPTSFWLVRASLAIAMAATLFPVAKADRLEAASFADDSPQLEYANGGPGYLGVDIHDVDAARAQQLKLKATQGAEVVALDHDAPACKAGMRIHDVILAVDGQPIRDAGQLHRVMHGMPAGKAITVAVSRNGKPLAISLTLADREALLEQAWAKHFRVPPPDAVPTIRGYAAENGFFSGGGPTVAWPAENPWMAGAEVDALGPQLASYFGVKDGSGLLVKSVGENSPAAAGGLRAGDVVLKANGAPLASRADWLQTWQQNPGKPVELIVLRDHRLRTMKVTVNASRTDSLLTPDVDSTRLLAQLDASRDAFSLNQGDLDRMEQDAQKALDEAGRNLNSIDQSAMEKALANAEKSMQSIDLESLRKQVEQAQGQMRAENMAALQKRLEDARKQMESVDIPALQKQVERAREQATQRLREQMQSLPSGTLPY